MMIYHPETYWNERQNPNADTQLSLRKNDLDHFRPMLEKVSTVLEFGPGLGRLFPLYKNMSRVATVDISRNYREQCSTRAKELGVNIEAHYLYSAHDPLPFGDNEFDLCIASQVLQHIPFEQIRNRLMETTRVAREVAVINAHDKSWPKSRADDPEGSWHCFAHDFPALCEELGIELRMLERLATVDLIIYAKN